MRRVTTHTAGTVAGAAIILSAALAAGAHASAVFYDVKSSTTSTVLHGGDRELLTLGFKGGAYGMTGANFGQFTDGSMTTLVGNSPLTVGWHDAIARDMSTAGNSITGNPDRADGSTAFASEVYSTGTLGEVFGTDVFGYKNLSWIIDGEESGSAKMYTIDLLFGGGRTVSADSDAHTVEFALLERGMDSDLNVYGIRADHTLTDPLFIGRSRLTYAGWKIDSLEISGEQKVGGVGISLDSRWTGLIGFRLEQKGGFGGPDIVAVGTSAPVPAPAVVTAIGLATLGGRRRRC